MVNSENIEAFNKAARIEDSLRPILPSDNISSIDIPKDFQEAISQIQKYLIIFFSSQGEKFDTEATKFTTPIETYVALLKKENKSLSDKVETLTKVKTQIELEQKKKKFNIVKLAELEAELVKAKAERENLRAKVAKLELKQAQLPNQNPPQDKV